MIADAQHQKPRNTTQRSYARAHPRVKRPSVEWSEAYLAALAETGQKKYAATLARVDRTTVFRRRRNDAEFARREKEAIEMAIDVLESEAVRRAVQGTVEEHYDRDGKLVSRRTRFSDTLLLRLLERLDPTWRQNYNPPEQRPGCFATRAERIAALEKAKAEEAEAAGRTWRLSSTPSPA